MENKRSAIRAQVDMIVAELQAVDDVHILDTHSPFATTLRANHPVDVKEQPQPATFVPVVKFSPADKK